jgi:ankyrin repeat protein
MVQLLLEAGASTGYPDRKGNSAVHLAVTRKDLKILKILAKSTSEFSAKNFAGNISYMHSACLWVSLDTDVAECI